MQKETKIPRKVKLEYIWIGGTGFDIRSKTRTIDRPVTGLEELDEWNCDGSSVGQAKTERSEIVLKPVALYNDPFRGEPHKLVLCETYHVDGTPTHTNYRHFAKKIFDKGLEEFQPTFGIEQEYFMFQNQGQGSGISWPYGWPLGTYPKPQFQYYCGNGAANVKGRDMVEDHLDACIEAGLEISGTNAEVAPSQWEYQIGKCVGIEIGDQIWISRFLLERIGEKYEVDINYSSKPVKGDWNGTGAHCNFSTKQSMQDGGFEELKKYIKNIEKSHKESMKLYGKTNNERMTGKHETSSMDKFTWGVADRSASIRISKGVENKGKGYLEDRRPGGDIDPYLVAGSLFSISCLDSYLLEEMTAHYNTTLDDMYKEK